MPLAALFREERLESWSMTPDEWAELKRSYRSTGLVMACGQEGIPKTSSLGTQFFAHKSGADCQLHEGGPESPEHLATKAAVAKAAREIGWEAVIEFPAADRSWIADVLVTNGVRTIAIEAQWSGQSLVDFERRQARYEAAGIECFWLVAGLNLPNASTVPHYELTGGVGHLHIVLPALDPYENATELGAGVQSILQGEILPVVELVATSATIKAQMEKCWHCDKWMSIWAVTALDLEARCGGRTTLLWHDPWPLWAQHRHEQALETPVRMAIEKSDLPAAVSLKLKFSEKADTNYIAMNCPSCGYVQGDGNLEWRWNAEQYDVPLGAGLRLPFTEQTRARQHVCRDIGRGRCSQAPTDGPTASPGYGYPPASERVVTAQYREEQNPLPPRGSRRRTGR
jgi:hypothetical protein